MLLSGSPRRGFRADRDDRPNRGATRWSTSGASEGGAPPLAIVRLATTPGGTWRCPVDPRTGCISPLLPSSCRASHHAAATWRVRAATMEAPRKGLPRALRRRPAVRAVHRPAPPAGRPPATRRPGRRPGPRPPAVRRGPLYPPRCLAANSAGAREAQDLARAAALVVAAAAAGAINARPCSARPAAASVSTSVVHALKGPAHASGPRPPSSRSPAAPFARGPIRSPVRSRFAAFRAEGRSQSVEPAFQRKSAVIGKELRCLTLSRARAPRLELRERHRRRCRRVASRTRRERFCVRASRER
jgi:hypothetical protein